MEQWRSSKHYATYIANLGGEEVATWTGATSCGNCHAIDAVEQRTKGNVITSGGGTVAGLAKGQLGYYAGTKETEALYGGKATVAAVYCTTCHKVDANNDPHKVGGDYQKGTFGFWVPTGPDDQALLEKSSAVGTADGTQAGKYTVGNACIWCHRGRKDVTNYILASNNTLGSNYWGPHESPQADVYTGKGGYHLTTQTYKSSVAHPGFADGCVHCHMPDVSTNDGYPDHSFYAQLSACAGCHAGATSFDVGGVQTKVIQALTELETALNDAGYLARPPANATGPNVALTPADIAAARFELDVVRVQSPALQIDAAHAGALYNYLVIARGSGKGVHNPVYVQELLYDSIVTMTGAPPVSIPTRP